MKERIIAIAADHGGYALKETIKKHLDEIGVEYVDYGTDSEASCNYSEFARRACNSIQDGVCDMGILVCGTGIGMSLAANKCRGIRAACCSDTFSIRMTRLHNDANVMCRGARVVGQGSAIDMVDLFMNTEFEGGRHVERIGMIAEIEKEGR